MRFVLHYRGQLPSNGNPTEKHEIRQKLHAQLAMLWNQRPLVDAKKLLERPETRDDFSSLRDVGGFTFAPLVTEQLQSVAELEITMLRPGPPGTIITGGGDIDNRLKPLSIHSRRRKRTDSRPEPLQRRRSNLFSVYSRTISSSRPSPCTRPSFSKTCIRWRSSY